MNSSVSIYIPRMSAMWTEDGVRSVMQDHHIGTVSRVDFISINKKPGFGENVDSVVRSAFVHFSDPYLTRDDHYQFRFEMYMGNTEFWEAIESGETWKLQVLDREYWLCAQNKNPVQRTMMNIHQVVENGRHLEQLVVDQAEEIKKLKEQRDAHEKRIAVLEQLICNHIRSPDIHVSFDSPPDTADCEKDESQDTELYHQKHSIIAQQKRRIDALEERLQTLENDLVDYGVLY